VGKDHSTLFKKDPSHWDKNICTLTAAEVKVTLGLAYRKDGASVASELILKLTSYLVHAQEIVVQLWMLLEDISDEFKIAWVLLEEKECIRHLMKGFEDCYLQVVFCQDAHGLAPEIATSAFLKHNSKAFINFLQAYTMAKKDMGKGASYFLLSQWWDKAMEGVPEPNMKGFNDEAYHLFTLNQNHFIGEHP
jgi:hypothetical protein